MVVGSDGEADFVVGELAETSRDCFLGTSIPGRGGLIDPRRAKANVSAGCGEDKVAGIT